MMKHAATSRVIPDILFIGVIGLLLVHVLASCTSNNTTRYHSLETYTLNLETVSNGVGLSDTLFTTPVDSVLFSGLIPQWPSVFLRQDYKELEYGIDFGDGTQTDNPYKKGSYLAQKHLYPRKGTYMARIWAEYDDSVYCGDTVYVHVQDYVWPTEAKTISVTITGIAINVFHVIERPGMRDSTYMTIEKDYTCSIAEDTNRVFRWDPLRGLYFSEPLEKLSNGMYWVSNNGRCTFLADGRTIQDLQLDIPVGDTLMRERHDNYANIKVERLTLKPGTNPTPAHAVYERTYSRTEFERRYSSYDKAAGYSYSIRDGNQIRRARTIHHSPYSDVTITVEFSK